jgi:5'(3')-deoxyribonucleotidase
MIPRRIAVDLDEVLAPMLPTMLRWRPPVRGPGHRHRYNYVYREIWGIPEHESVKLVRDFYESPEFACLPVIPGALETLRDLKAHGHQLYVVTGRQRAVRDKTERWVEQNFPDIFRAVILTDSYTAFEVPKDSVCRALGAATLIDDNIDACLAVGPGALNFIGDPMYPWCTETAISVTSWEHVRSTLIGTRETF